MTESFKAFQAVLLKQFKIFLSHEEGDVKYFCQQKMGELFPVLNLQQRIN